jgi:hypothetical protein
VHRRFSAILIVWVGLLAPAGAVALGCTTAAGDGDCCPAGSFAHCGDPMPPIQPQPVSACCHTAPSPSRTLVVDSSRAAWEREKNSGSPDFAVIVGAVLPSRQSVLACRPPRCGAADMCGDGTLTFLLTGRLRL